MADRERPPSFELSSVRVRCFCISMLQVVELGASVSWKFASVIHDKIGAIFL